MRIKFVESCVFGFIAVCGGITILQNASLPEAMPGDVGAAFFPSSIAWIMIGLCVVGIGRSVFRENRDILHIPGLPKILVTIGALSAFLILWQMFGLFYLLSIILLVGLHLYYSLDEAVNARLVGLSVVTSTIVVGLVYLFFNYVLYTKF